MISLKLSTSEVGTKCCCSYNLKTRYLRTTDVFSNSCLKRFVTDNWNSQLIFTNSKFVCRLIASGTEPGNIFIGISMNYMKIEISWHFPDKDLARGASPDSESGPSRSSSRAESRSASRSAKRLSKRRSKRKEKELAAIAEDQRNEYVMLIFKSKSHSLYSFLE